MLGNGRHGGHGGSGGAAFAAALALALGACSFSDGLFGSSRPSAPSTSSPGGSSFSQRMNAFFFGPSGQGAESGTMAAAVNADMDCPAVDIRSGASTLSVAASGAEPTATNLRFQASIAQTARECAVLGATMTIKVGVQGRIILGPAGAPGPVEVPMRIALVREGIEPRTIWTRLYRVPVTVPPGQSNVPFVQVEEDITFPTPKPAELEAYIVYVGFDPTGLKAQPERRPAKKAR